MYYLLGTQVFLDLAKSSHGPTADWLAAATARGISRARVKISCMSWWSLQAALEQHRKEHDGQLPLKHRSLPERTENLFNYYEEADCILPVTYRATRILVNELAAPIFYTNDQGTEIRLEYPEKSILATAIAGHRGEQITLVDRHQAAHDALRLLGLTVEDPYAGRR